MHDKLKGLEGQHPTLCIQMACDWLVKRSHIAEEASHRQEMKWEQLQMLYLSSLSNCSTTGNKICHDKE